MTIARNLTRQVEIYFPIFFLFQIGSNENHLLTIIDFVFVVGVFVLPLISRDTLRLGDYLAGTLVIIAPKAALLEDLSAKSQKDAVFTFTEKQLGIYGDLELKTLETALRLANSKLSPALGQIAKAIVKKINYEREIASHETIRFLSDFYAAERGLLERGRLFGLRKDSQNSPAAPPVQGVASGKKPPELPKNPTLKSGAKTTEAQLGLANAQPKSTPQSPLDKWRAQRRTPPSRS
jgi:hypothetical protein